MNIKLNLPDIKDVVLQVPDELSKDYIIKSLTDFGNWEPGLTQKVNLILKKANLQKDKNYIFLDIGACFGYYSIIASNHGIPSIAFEPNPKTSTIIKQHIENNSTSITLREYALGNKAEVVHLVSPDGNIGGTRIETTEKDVNTVPVKRLDDENIKENIILAKIDVEGKESEVIVGGMNLLKNNPPEFLLVEISPLYSSIEIIMNDIFIPLWDLGYLSFDLGVQEMGSFQETFNVFKLFNTIETLREFLLNKNQTNFLFIKKHKNDIKLLTGEDWKDEMIIQWSQEYSSNLNDKLYLSNFYLNEATEKLSNLNNGNSVDKILDTIIDKLEAEPNWLQDLQNKYEDGFNLILETLKNSDYILVDKLIQLLKNEFSSIIQQVTEKTEGAERRSQETIMAKWNQIESYMASTSQNELLNAIQEKTENVLSSLKKFDTDREEEKKQDKVLSDINYTALQNISAILEQNKDKIVVLENKFVLEVEEKNKQIAALVDINHSLENKLKLETDEKKEQIAMFFDKNAALEHTFNQELNNKNEQIQESLKKNEELQKKLDSFIQKYYNKGIIESIKHKIVGTKK